MAASKKNDEGGQDAPATVAMKRDPEIYPEPHSADVHPDEVGVWTAAGWAIA